MGRSTIGPIILFQQASSTITMESYDVGHMWLSVHTIFSPFHGVYMKNFQGISSTTRAVITVPLMQLGKEALWICVHPDFHCICVLDVLENSLPLPIDYIGVSHFEILHIIDFEDKIFGKGWFVIK